MNTKELSASVVRARAAWAWCCAAAALCVSTGHAFAGFSFLSQMRTITAHAMGGTATDSDSASAVGFGTFDQTVSASATDPFTGFGGWGTGSQHSTLGELEISVGGQWSGGRTGQGNNSGGGSSSFFVVFSLDAAAPATLVLTGTNVPPLVPYLEGPGVQISSVGTFELMLQPGTYSMRNSASGSAGFPAGGGGFGMRLTIVPAPGAGAAGLVAGVVLSAGRRRRVP